MRRSDYQREENYNEYLRLLQNSDYPEVMFDEESGGMSAIHKYHKFDKQRGPYGCRRGDYERCAVNVLRNNGFRVLLESEISTQEMKISDGYLDDRPMEIKSVEGKGTWTVSTKLRNAVRQQARCVILYYPNADNFSWFQVTEGLRLFLSSPETDKGNLESLIVISGDKILADWNKKTTPIEGWSIWEGLRGQNGADPFTILPSDTKV